MQEKPIVKYNYTKINNEQVIMLTLYKLLFLTPNWDKETAHLVGELHDRANRISTKTTSLEEIKRKQNEF